MDKEYIISKVKLLLPNSDENPDYDEIIGFTVDKIMNDVANYCNISVDELPKELSMVVVNMTLQPMNTTEFLYGKDNSATIQSLNDGDTIVTFRPVSDVYMALQSLNPITDNYTSILNNFRRLPE